MKKSKSRLNLNAETVRELTDSESSRAAGGGVTYQTCGITQWHTCNMACGYSGPPECLTGNVCPPSLAC